MNRARSSRLILRLMLVPLSVALALSGCATTNGTGVANGGGDPCNAWATGAIGAVVGGLLARNSSHAAVAALAGAAVGAATCAAINSHARQVRTAQAVEDEYRQRNAGRLPAAPRVLAYNTRVEPATPVPAGEKVQIRSSISVVSGATQPVREVREELVLLDTAGNEFQRAQKVVSQDGNGGEYENTFNFAFPQGVSQGVYGVETKLYVNGREMSKQQNRLRLAIDDRGRLLVAALD